MIENNALHTASLKWFAKTLPHFLSSPIILLLFLLSVPCNEIFGKDTKVHVAPLPSWITNIQPQIDATVTSAELSGGYYYLLVDRQEQILSETSFIHQVIKIMNNDGIQSMSDIDINFDPNYQHLTFHEINIYRNGQKISKLKLSDFKTVQREEDMDRYIYDESLTAYMNLKDIRIGDILEYSYSLKGYNPVFKDQFSAKYYMEYSVPVHQIFTRLLVPAAKKLFFNYPNGQVDVKTSQLASQMEYVWKRENVKALNYDKDYPSWYEKDLNVRISTFANWADIALWEIQHYQVSDLEFQKIKKQAVSLFKSERADSNILTAIHFVQNDIRYLGFESGLNGYKPQKPSTVLEARFGDCKDKSLLLCALLKVLDVEAFPVLTNSNQIPSAKSGFPTSDIFNHCIVQINFQGKQYYIDPTISNQGGLLTDYYIPQYGLGLVLKKETTGLTEIKNADKSKTIIKNSFIINDLEGGAELKISTEYYGGDADDQRSGFATSGSAAIQKKYVDYYSKIYGGLKTKRDIVFKDNLKDNIFTVEEEYQLDSIWSISRKKSSVRVCQFYPPNINDIVNIARTGKRSMPYNLKYPLHIEEKIVIYLPSDWTISPFHEVITDSAFIFHSEGYNEKNIVYLNYSFVGLKSFVTAEKYDSFYKMMDNAANDITYELTFNHDSNALDGFGSPLYLIVVLGAIFVGIIIYYKRRG